MKNTDMHVVNAFANGEFEVLDTYSTGHRAPGNDSSMGGTYDIKDIIKENDQGDFITISYTRSLDTKDPYDYVIKTVKKLIRGNSRSFKQFSTSVCRENSCFIILNRSTIFHIHNIYKYDWLSNVFHRHFQYESKNICKNASKPVCCHLKFSF